MRFRTVLRVPQSKNRPPLLYQPRASPWFSQIHSRLERPSFGIAFDIDGVILRGRVPIGGSPQAMRRLYGESGGGIPESRRAIELGELLGVRISPSQVVQGHTPFKNLLNRYENELIVAAGKGEPAVVMFDYGFKKVLSLDEYASYFKDIDPVSQYKNWTTNQEIYQSGHSIESASRYNVLYERVKAAFVVSDPVDWGRDIQVLCDILTSGGLPGRENGHQPPLYFAADDLEYQNQQSWTMTAYMFNVLSCPDLPPTTSWIQAAFPSERLGMGAFRTALESVFNRIHHNTLEYVSFGKPNPFVFKNAEAILRQLQPSYHDDHLTNNGDSGFQPFKTLYMIGDNPFVDVKGAKQAGHPWFSILTRTGVFKGKDNHPEFPADLVVDTVEEAVDYILGRECTS
ncbi:HAD-superfamily hydrolase, subfamily IIA, CECR [Trema orientale]|uniref:HAD-superfamily hydrolase, subfamily IIA, CECR n=1 Tax=Trema orientale TaxID=63057 RepID=A0A2P5CTD7_TREOI|nr:HAD-superfamily hydrolase, subfamily IIA, CECR [Trema orientale]